MRRRAERFSNQPIEPDPDHAGGGSIEMHGPNSSTSSSTRSSTCDLRLYALVDPEHSGGRDLAELARLVAQGGATLVQLRDKRSDTRPMVERARAIKAALAPFNVPLLINDRVDVALAAGADGVHVGQRSEEHTSELQS